MILIVDAGNTTITFAAVSEENDSIVKRIKVEEDRFQEDAINIEKSDELLDKWCKDIVKALCDKELTCHIGKSSMRTSYMTSNAPRGSHCGGIEDVADATRCRRSVSRARHLYNTGREDMCIELWYNHG